MLRKPNCFKTQSMKEKSRKLFGDKDLVRLLIKQISQT